MSVPLLPLFNSLTNPGPDCWVDALNQIINYLNTNFYYNPTSSGGAGAFRKIISPAVNDTISGLDFNGTIGWASTFAAQKLETLIAGPAGTPVRVTLKDLAASAGTYNIAVQASGCTVESGSTHAGVTGDDGYITYEWDGTSNWMVVA